MAFRKRSGQTEAAAPWLMVILLIAIVIVAIVAYLKATSLLYSDASKTTNYMLYTILSSTNCTPQTKIPFRDVLSIGIGEGQTKWNDNITITYGGVEEGRIELPFGLFMYAPISVGSCISIFNRAGVFGEKSYFHFYVEHSSCPKGRCFEVKLNCVRNGGCATRPSDTINNVVSYEYIALPGGDVAKVVFKTNDGRFA